MDDKNKIGTIVWRDLTVKDAKAVSGFYQKVVGWSVAPVSMGDYDDYNMNLPSDESAGVDEGGSAIAGICHARGDNAALPSQWMMYVRVSDVVKSIEVVKASGGKVLSGPRSFGGDTYYAIQDPEGAVLTIFS